jgi:hypothetical protein
MVNFHYVCAIFGSVFRRSHVPCSSSSILLQHHVAADVTEHPHLLQACILPRPEINRDLNLRAIGQQHTNLCLPWKSGVVPSPIQILTSQVSAFSQCPQCPSLPSSSRGRTFICLGRCGRLVSRFIRIASRCALNVQLQLLLPGSLVAGFQVEEPRSVLLRGA